MKYILECVFTTPEGDKHEARIDARQYGGKWKAEAKLGGDDNDRQWALDVLSEVLSASYFTKPGTRNDSAVDGCCALHCLGCADVESWFRGFFADCPRFFKKEYVDLFLDHVGRVALYLNEWGPEGYEEDVQNYTIDY